MVQAWRHARDERDFWGRGPGAAALMLDHARAAFLPDWSRALKRRTRLLAGRTMPADKLMCPTFARRIDVAGRKHLLAERAPSPKQAYASDRLAAILHPNAVVGRERYDRVASVFGLEARDPFLDLRLVRFALSLPPEQLVRGGSTKFVLRKAMAGLLPDDVRWRRGKDHLGRTFIAAALTTRAEDRSHMIDRQRSSLEKWIKPARVEEARARDAVLDDPSLQAVGHLASWLESSFHDKVLPSPGVATKKPAARTMCSEGRPNE
jgi:asparagine synthase (glutamine-hydrolysing)